MVTMRIGLVPNTSHEDAPRLHRAALVVSREASQLPRYGRARLGTLTDAAGAHRLSQVGAVVIWGCQDAAIAGTLQRHPAALVVLITKSKTRKDSAVGGVLDELRAAGVTVETYTIAAKADVVALDIAPGRAVLPVADLTEPPSARTHSAPQRPAVEAEAEPLPAPPRPPAEE
jgi:hypothetical protein